MLTVPLPPHCTVYDFGTATEQREEKAFLRLFANFK